jgi:hypothetical protein
MPMGEHSQQPRHQRSDEFAPEAKRYVRLFRLRHAVAGAITA